MRHPVKKHRLDGLIALLLFGVFAACVLSVLLTGADVYRRLTERDRESYALRTCVQFVATKARQAASGGAVRVDSFDGVDALTVEEVYDGEVYVTRVYSYDGWLRELFTFDGGDLLPEDGERIIEAGDMSMSLEDGLFTVTLAGEDGEDVSLSLALRGEGAEE